MEYGINRNGSGYYDPTACEGIKNYLKGDIGMEIYSGDIFTAKLNNGLEREFVILSVHDRFSTVLMLNDDSTLPYSIKSNGIRYTNPGMVQYIFNNQFREFIRSLSLPEFKDIQKAVIDYLGYKVPDEYETKEAKQVVAEIKTVEVEKVPDGLIDELTKTKAERDVYKSLYDNLISSMIGK